jgi:hypothetical protein
MSGSFPTTYWASSACSKENPFSIADWIPGDDINCDLSKESFAASAIMELIKESSRLIAASWLYKAASCL